MEGDCFASFFATPYNDVHAGVSAIKFIAPISRNDDSSAYAIARKHA
jgi:hypothetical protein